ncbi:MAG: hypothetical protein U9N14_03155, partial [Pseudomonadota bacterium]|nr:hypothetical protein [Pseudomonadota bacterium]
MNDRSNLPPTAKALMRHLSAPDYIGRALGAHLRTASKGASICAVSAVNTERTVDLFFESRKLDDTAQRMLRLATPKVRRDVRELITAWEAEGDAIAALKKHSKHCADLAHLYHFDPHAPVDMTGHNLSDSVPQNDPALAGVLAAIARRRAIHTRIYEHDPRTAMVAGTILTTMRGERTALAALARLPEGDLRRLRIDLARKRLVGRIWDRVESWPRRPMTEDNGPIAEYDEKARVMLTTATARGQALHDWASPSLESALIDIRK